MKILFLDIDGVLNKDSTKEKFCGFTGLDKKLLKRFLGWKALRQDVSIVLSSSWRVPTAFGDFKQHLMDAGITWMGETPILGTDRGLEILSWIKDFDAAAGQFRFAIVDDNNDMRPLHKYLVQTSPKDGLTDKNLKAIDKLLGYETP